MNAGYDVRVRTAEFDYPLPEGRIAQHPRPRGASRLLVLDRRSGAVSHHRVADLPGLLDPGDLVLLNDTRVIPARLEARRPTGRRFELLLLERRGAAHWEALLRPSARTRAGERLVLSDGGAVVPELPLGDGAWRLRFDPALELDRLERIGEPPLPPYIDRPEGAESRDRGDYQTVYAREPGAVAAPTAGLHLTPELIASLRGRGLEVATLTLHVGIGTFRPVAVDDVSDHRMHAERYEIPDATARAVNRSLADGRRILCVGTTSVRALEGGLAAGSGVLRAGWTSTEIFLVPGARVRGVGALLTNFHLPRSTLLMLVSTLAGRAHILDAYREALASSYRVFSYGDAMLIL